MSSLKKCKVGSENVQGITGKEGLGTRNAPGDKLIEFCAANELTIANTIFTQPNRRKYTWTSPGGKYRNQIDYIITQKRWQSSILNCHTLPGADCGTDHELLIAKIKLRLKKLKTQPPSLRFDLQKIPNEFIQEIRHSFQQLNTNNNAQELWEKIKEILINKAKELIPPQKKRINTHWIREETIKIAGMRRVAKKNRNTLEGKAKYKRLSAEFQRLARNDKNAYYNSICDEIELDIKKGRTRDVFLKIKQLTKTFIPKNSGIKDENGVIMEEPDCIKERWQSYTECLYRKDDTTMQYPVKKEYEEEPPIMKEEVKNALHSLANRKAPGFDDIPIELWKNLDDECIDLLTKLCQNIFDTGNWPTDWKRSVYVPFHKKGDVRECSNYRTIALISHTSKILLKIIQSRFEGFLDREVAPEQAGFRKKRGTRDHISNIRRIIEAANERQNKVYFCFIDYSKAFDCVDHGKLWKSMLDMGASKHLVYLLQQLYENQEATVRTEHGDCKWFKIGKGVRQGCILSPLLFNIYAEMIMRNVTEKHAGGFKIGGSLITNLRYADDTTLLACTKEELINIIMAVKKESLKFGLRLNVKKTKVMSNTDLDEVMIEGDKIEIVNEFNFLGSSINAEGDSTPEIKRRIVLGKATMTKLKALWKNKQLTKVTKIRLVKALVYPVVTYASETWVMKKRDKNRIEAFEMWCWRRLLNISWTDHITNKDVLERVGNPTALLCEIVKLKLSFFGHIIRSDGLEKTIMLGMTEGARRRGRPRRRWLDDIQDETELSIEKLIRTAEDRRKWKSLSITVTRIRQRIGGTR